MNAWREDLDVGRWSLGSSIAWQIASAEAAHQGHEFVEPLHVLLGIASIEKVVGGDLERSFGLGADAIASLRAEFDALSSILAPLKLKSTSLRHLARAEVNRSKRTAVSTGEQLVPSPVTFLVLREARRFAGENDSRPVGVLHVLTALVECGSSPVPEFLGRYRVPVQKLTASLRKAVSYATVLPDSTACIEGGEPSGIDKVDSVSGETPASKASSDPATKTPSLTMTDEAFEVSRTISADSSGLVYVAAATERLQSRLALLYQLPLHFAEQTKLERLFETIVERLLAVIPGATRGALIVSERTSGKLLLKAHLPPGRPAVSLTLARKAMDRREGFIWQQELDMSASVFELSCTSGMYAPLMWRQEVLGVVCVDNFGGKRRFEDEDLRLLLAVARYAGMALENRNLQEDLTLQATLLSRLLTNFSPTVRDCLLKKARQGKLQLGGEKSEVTILCSDIRGFTQLSANMDANETVEMLNSYLPPLVDKVFRFKGTVDKYVGDSILAVFGSPEPDPEHHTNAVRAAVAMQAVIDEVSAEREKRDLISCAIGIGIHCGEVLHGFIGAPDRIEFTVIGDAVNMAARFCDAAEAGQILVSPKVHEHTWRMLDAEALLVPTKHEGMIPAYRVKSIQSS